MMQLHLLCLCGWYHAELEKPLLLLLLLLYHCLFICCCSHAPNLASSARLGTNPVPDVTSGSKLAM
jgi:hypothetical protein